MFPCVLSRLNSSLIFSDEQNSNTASDSDNHLYVQCVYLSTDRYLGCFRVQVTANKAVIKIPPVGFYVNLNFHLILVKQQGIQLLKEYDQLLKNLPNCYPVYLHSVLMKQSRRFLISLLMMWGINALNFDHSNSYKVMVYSVNLYLQIVYVVYMSLLIAYLQPTSYLHTYCTPTASAAIGL